MSFPAFRNAAAQVVRPVVLVLAAICAGALALPVEAEAAESAGSNGSAASGAPLRFRRMYAPADRPEAWPRQHVPYFPMQPGEFERLLELARTAAQVGGNSVAVAVASAEYKARLEGEELVDGEATLEVVHSSDHRAALALDPCGLAISEAAWAGEDDRPAALGQGPDGKLTVVVEKPGRLRLNWSLRGGRDNQGGIEFPLELPPCPSNRLILELPETMIPVTDCGIVVQETIGADQTSRWRIELGGHHRVRLRVVPAEDAENRRQLTRVRQSLVYDCSLQGIELSTHLQLDVYDEPLRQIVLAVDPGLKLVTARYGSVAIPWSSLAPRPGDPATRVLLEFPEPVQGMGRVIRLGFLAPLPLGTPRRLPGIRPEAMFWQEGNATLMVSSPLVLEQLTPIRSRQVKVGPMPAPWSGETVELQYFASDAGVEVVFGRPRAALQLNCGTVVELSGGEMTARTAADFTATKGEVFTLEAQVARQWIIDTVEAVPAEVLGDWSLDKDEGGPRKLTIRLAKALSPSRPVQLRITGRRLHSPLGRWLGVDDLVPLRFPDARGGRRLVALDSVKPYQLKTTGTDQLTLVDSQSLEPAVARLLSGAGSGLLFERDAGAAALRVSLVPQRPQYAATIRVEAAAIDDSLVESYRLSCIPAGAPIDRVLVKFSHSRGQPLQWTLVNGGDDSLTVRLLDRHGMPSEEAQGTGVFEHGPPAVSEDDPKGLRSPWGDREGSSAGETWEITLHEPQSVPFEIRARWNGPLGKRQPIRLASLPEATGQRATLVVSSNDATVVRVEGSQLEPIPTEVVPADQYTSARATYRYYPAQNSAPSPEAILVVQPRSSPTVLPAAWAWSCRLESYYDTSGTGRHLAVYHLQSAGRRALELTLPPGARLEDVRGVWIDEARASWHRTGAKGRRQLAVELPAGRKFPVLSIQYTTLDEPLGFIDSLHPALPKIDVPVLACRWTVWLPPGHEAVDTDLRWQPRRAPPLTWRQRLFGPLGRGPVSVPFDPFDPGHWSAMLGDQTARLAAEGKARRLLEEIGKAAASGRQQQTDASDWLAVLTAPAVEKTLADRSGGQERLVLLADWEALAQLGITPHAPLAEPAGGTALARGAALLQQANLTLLVHSKAIVLTSAIRAALDRAHLEAVDKGVMWWIASGPLADRVQGVVEGQVDETFVPMTVWQEKPDDIKPPWRPVRPSGFQPSDTLGWNACQLEISGTTPVRLDVVHVNTMRALRWTVFLAVVALIWWRPVRPARRLLALAGLLGIAALLLPAAYVPMVSGALLGILFCLAWRLGERGESPGGNAEPPAPSRSASPGSMIASGIPMLLAGIVLVQLSGLARGEEPTAHPSATSASNGSDQRAFPAPAPPPATPAEAPKVAEPAPTVFNVLIPVDENDRPTGEPYQVPERLYQELHRRAAKVTEEPQGWLLSGATYRGSLVWQGTPEALAPGELKATFELRVFSPQTQVRLRLGREGLNLVPDGATLDGRVIQPEWEEDGSVLTFDVEEPGEYQLELAVRPSVQRGGTASGFELAIPRLAGSRLDLTLPPNAPPVEIPSALGTVVQEADPRRVLAELGPSERLSVRWKDAAAGGPNGSAVDVEELLWLKVQPDSVVLEARFKFRIVEGRVGELRLAADPRLRLLPFPEEDTAVAEVETIPGQPQTIRLVLARPISEPFELAASFLLTETSGIGRLRLPRLEVLDVRTTKRWLAVWVDPALEYEQQTSGPLEAVAVPAFSAAWGPAAVQPLLAYNLAPGELSWELATRPLEPHTVAAQTLALSFDLEEILVQLDAELKTSSGYNFQYRLRAPAELEVDEVSLRAEDLEHVARWSRARDGTIHLFLNAPVTAEQRLSLRGRLAVKNPGDVRLPVLRIDGVETRTSRLRIFRKPAVLLRVLEAQGLKEDESPLVHEDTAPLGRLLKSFQIQGSEPVEARVALVPNRPRVRAEQRTTVRFDGQQREAKVEFRIEVERGVVDQWRLDVPPQWSGPYQVDPPATTKVVTVPGDSRQLIIQPRSAVTGAYRLSVSGPLTLASSDPVRAPEIRLEGAELVSHLLIVPTQWQLHPVVWETQGLEQVPLPEDFAAVPVSREAFVAYRAEQPSFQAVLKPLGGLPQVFLADVSLAWQADGTCYGVALFDLRAAGLAHCWLRLPVDYRLVQVTVAGVPTTPLRSMGNRWQIPLSPSAFPQRMEVLFTGRLAELSLNGTCRLEAPILDELPIRQTLWTIAGPPLCQPSPAEGTETIGRLEQEMIRLRNVSALIEEAAETTAEEPEQTVQWYRTWARRWLDLGEEVRRQLALPAASEVASLQAQREEIARELESLTGQQSPAARRLAESQVMAQLVSERPVASSPDRLWLTCPDCSSPVIRCVSEGGAGVLRLVYRPVEAGSFFPRLRAALMLAALVGLAIWTARRGTLVALFGRWPQTVGVLAGLAWWLWLRPSALGWAIVLVSLAAALRPPWRSGRVSRSLGQRAGPSAGKIPHHLI